MVSKFFKLLGKSVKFLVFILITADEAYNFQLAFGNSTGLIRKEYVQATCRFNTYKLTDKHVVVEHFAHIQ